MEYGRLGLGKEDLTEKSEPTIVPVLHNTECINVDCGTAVSFAITNDGTKFVCHKANNDEVRKLV